MKVIIGLGNPGKKYENTPHNIGFKVIDKLAMQAGCALRKNRNFSALFAKTVICDYDILLVKPYLFVNNSGEVVNAILTRKKIAIEDLIVISDDANLEVGQIRVRHKGGDGGHRGLRSIIEHTGSEQFARVRVGIGRNQDKQTLSEHVLTPVSKKELMEMKRTLERAAEAVHVVLEKGIEAAMNQFNARIQS